MRIPFTEDKAVLELSKYSTWYKNIGHRTRNMINKSQLAGVMVKQVLPDEAFWVGVSGIYNESPTRRDKPFRHYGKTPEQSREVFKNFMDPEENIYLGAYCGDWLIGFAHLLWSYDGWHISALLCYQSTYDKAPMNALLNESVRILCNKGETRLTYGIMQRDGLRHFKESNGFKAVRMLRWKP